MPKGTALSYYYKVAVVLLTTPMVIVYGKSILTFILKAIFTIFARFCLVYNQFIKL